MSNHRNPGTAAVLSFFIPGLGQVYNGSFASAVLAFFCLALGLLTLWLLIGIPLLIITWVCSVLGAYETAIRRNQYRSTLNETLNGYERFDMATVETYKKCPDCAELVKTEAKLCRFCGYQFVSLTDRFEVNLN